MENGCLWFAPGTHKSKQQKTKTKNAITFVKLLQPVSSVFELVEVHSSLLYALFGV